jgi:hypothetical protein
MEKRITNISHFTIEISDKDIKKFVSQMLDIRVPEDAIVRLYTEYGDYRDIDEDHPIQVFFEEKKEE